MALAVLTIPAVVFFARAISIMGKDGARVKKTGMAEMIAAIPWLFVMFMCIGTCVYCILSGLFNGSDTGFAELIIHFGGAVAGKYYLPILGLISLICGIIALTEKNVKRFAVDILFTAVFAALWTLCWTGAIFRLWRVFEERPK